MFWLPDLFTVVSELKPFYFYEIATAADGFSFDNDKRIGRIMT